MPGRRPPLVAWPGPHRETPTLRIWDQVRRIGRGVRRWPTRTIERGLVESPYHAPEVEAGVRSELAAPSPTAAGQDRFDARRIAVAIEYIRRFDLSRGTVMEAGSLDNPAARLIWERFPDARPRPALNDFRKEPLQFEDGSVDSVVCLEVLEHLSDIEYRHATTLSGLFYFLEEVYRVLGVGGRALFTTPNAASLLTIGRALEHEPPMQYPWHFREYSVGELRRILEHVGFRVVSLRTEFVWRTWDLGRLARSVSRLGHSLENRGDDIFAVVEKPAERVRPPHGLDLPV